MASIANAARGARTGARITLLIGALTSIVRSRRTFRVIYIRQRSAAARVRQEGRVLQAPASALRCPPCCPEEGDDLRHRQPAGLGGVDRVEIAIDVTACRSWPRRAERRPSWLASAAEKRCFSSTAISRPRPGSLAACANAPAEPWRRGPHHAAAGPGRCDAFISLLRAMRSDGVDARESGCSVTVACPAPTCTVAVANPYTLVRAAGHGPGWHASPPSISPESEPSMNAPLPDSVRKALESVTLDDKYSLEHGRAFMSGTQALVRLPMLQKKRDAMFGLKTGGFISGYRGSPLGGYDQALWQAKSASRGAGHRLPARRQRGARRDRGLGHAAARPLSRVEALRRRVRHLVRQGPGRRPLLRRLQARQHRRHREARRRDRPRRRRPHRQELDRGAPERPHLQGLRPAGVLPVERAGHPRHGPARVRDEPLRRRLVGR